MSEYLVWLKSSVHLNVEAESEEEAKQMLADALAGWGVEASEIGVEEM